MIVTLFEMCEKDVISTQHGVKLGHIDDLRFDEKSAVISHVIIYGKSKLFGLLGKEKDTVISWAEIQQIGNDVVLVSTPADKKARRRHKLFTFLD